MKFLYVKALWTQLSYVPRSNQIFVLYERNPNVGKSRRTGPSTMESSLQADDCFYIAEESAKRQDHDAAVVWLLECNDRFDEATQIQAAHILFKSALFIGEKELSRESLSFARQYDSSSRKLQDLSIRLGTDLGNWLSDWEFDQYESFKVCAGDYEDKAASGSLRCRYNHHNSPFLVIAPLKEEILSIEPKVSLFKEVIYDSEIDLMKADAYELFQTAVIFADGNDGTQYPDVNFRPSQTAWVDHTQPKYEKLYLRLQDISSLSLNLYSEFFQMLHYAPGGFYRGHTDYIHSEPVIAEGGNRLATALMYLNDVVLGGSTVFPYQKIAVQPVKGSVLFWINMRVDGSEVSETLHAACPVLYGEKIAATQWFRTRGQDHWATDPEYDVKSTYSMNPNIMCLKR